MAVSQLNDVMPVRSTVLKPPETFKISDVFAIYGPWDQPNLIWIPLHSSVDAYDDDFINDVIISRSTVPELRQTRLQNADFWLYSLRTGARRASKRKATGHPL